MAAIVTSDSTPWNWADNTRTWNSVDCHVKTWASSQLSDFTLAVTEGAGIVELCAKILPSVDIGEGVSLAEAYLAARAIDLDEQLGVAEEFARSALFLVAAHENLGIAETLAKALGLNLGELLHFLDEYIRRANAVISDILFDGGDLTDEEFVELMSSAVPPGFEKFRAFLPGDYQYDRALFKEVLRSAAADRPRLNALTVKVDVPDVTDRGSVSFDGSARRVAFSRTFLSPPEVSLTLKQAPGVLVIPRIVGPIDNDGFSVEALDGNGNPVSVVLGWIAQGF